MSLMAQVEQARNRLQESNQQLLAASGAIKGMMAASLKLEREARKVTYELKEDHRRIVQRHRERFMREQLNTIRADPSHPLRGLLNSRGDDWFGRNHGRPRNNPQVEIGVQAGHLKGRAALLQELNGELERFAVEDSLLNQLDGRNEGEGPTRGVIFDKTALDIGGVAVETQTARDYAKLGYIDEDVVANAPKHPGWTAPNSLFTESIPDAAGSSQLRGILRGGSRALGPLGVALDAYSLKEAWDADGGRIGENVTSTAGGIAGGLGGAAAGAAIGSAILPVGGTIIGGVIGGVVGSGAGSAIAEGIGNLFD